MPRKKISEQWNYLSNLIKIKEMARGCSNSRTLENYDTTGMALLGSQNPRFTKVLFYLLSATGILKVWIYFCNTPWFNVLFHYVATYYRVVQVGLF